MNRQNDVSYCHYHYHLECEWTFFEFTIAKVKGSKMFHHSIYTFINSSFPISIKEIW